MPSVRETVRNGLWFYPSLYDNRTQVLHKAFCSSGGGYEWVDGELVNVTADYARLERERPRHTSETAYVAWKVNEALSAWLSWQLTIVHDYDDRTDELLGRRVVSCDAPERARVEAQMLPVRIEVWRRMAVQECAKVRYNRANIERLIDTPGRIWPGDDGRRRAGRAPVPDRCDAMNPQYVNLARLPGDITADWLDAAEEIARYIVKIKGLCDAHNDAEYGRRAAQVNVQIAAKAMARIMTLRADRRR